LLEQPENYVNEPLKTGLNPLKSAGIRRMYKAEKPQMRLFLILD